MIPDVDPDDLTPIYGWYCDRIETITEDGVDSHVALVLLDQDDDTPHGFIMSLDVAQRCGFDLLGEGGGWFG